MKKNYSDLYKERFYLKYKNLYDYSLMEYIKANLKIKIICKEHGLFEQEPIVHLRSGCPKCSKNYTVLKEDFIIQANKIHNNLYDYSKIDFKNMNTKIKIICKEHGEFEQVPSNHVSRSSGCPKCNGGGRFNKEYFIIQANKTHNDLYDYSQVNYMNNHTKVKIICKTHGEFEQAPSFHIHRKNGCPKCKESQGERKIRQLLEKYNIKYVKEYSFIDCLSPSNKLLKFDFYLPVLDIIIEYDGIQHFEPVDFFGGEESFKKTQLHDQIKNNYCKKKNIYLIRLN